MAKMIDLKLTPAESKEESAEAQESKGPQYPYGTCLYLDTETMTKLGLTPEKLADLIKTKTPLMITASAMVKGMSMSKSGDGTEYNSGDIQLMSMSIAEQPAEEKSLGEKVYGPNGAAPPPKMPATRVA